MLYLTYTGSNCGWNLERPLKSPISPSSPVCALTALTVWQRYLLTVSYHVRTTRLVFLCLDPYLKKRSKNAAQCCSAPLNNNNYGVSPYLPVFISLFITDNAGNQLPKRLQRLSAGLASKNLSTEKPSPKPFTY